MEELQAVKEIMAVAKSVEEAIKLTARGVSLAS